MNRHQLFRCHSLSCRHSPAARTGVGLLLFLFLNLLPAAQCRGASPASLVEQGNKAYGAADYDKALQLYDEAAKNEKAEPAIIAYNRGNALYRLNDFDGARRAYEKAAQDRKNNKLAARSYFNMGNAAFRQGEAIMQQAPDRAMTSFTDGAAAYREALRLAPQLSGAGANLELTNRRIKELAAQMQQQQQAGQGKQNKSSDQDKGNYSQPLPDLAQRQKQLATETEKLQNGRQEKKEQQQAANALAGDQQKLRQETEQQMRQNAGKEGDGQSEDLESIMELQQRAEEKLRSKDLQQAFELQKMAAEQLRQAAENTRQRTDNSNAKKEQKKSTDQNDKEPPAPEKQLQTGEQPETANGQDNQATPPPIDPGEILNREKIQRQLRRQRMLSAGGRQVEKDW